MLQGTTESLLGNLFPTRMHSIGLITHQPTSASIGFHRGDRAAIKQIQLRYRESRQLAAIKRMVRKSYELTLKGTVYPCVFVRIFFSQGAARGNESIAQINLGRDRAPIQGIIWAIDEKALLLRVWRMIDYQENHQCLITCRTWTIEQDSSKQTVANL